MELEFKEYKVMYEYYVVKYFDTSIEPLPIDEEFHFLGSQNYDEHLSTKWWPKEGYYLCGYKDIQPDIMVDWLATGHRVPVNFERRCPDHEDCCICDGTHFSTSELDLPVYVIGPVSRTAGFVTEGMKFNHNQLEYIFADRHFCVCQNYKAEGTECSKMVSDYRGGEFCNNTEKILLEIKVQCSNCKHYH